MTAFWILAPLMVFAALGLVFSRKAVHGALFLAVGSLIGDLMLASVDPRVTENEG